jgi:hypothetical protein
MGFDQNDAQPIIRPARKTTQVNFMIVSAVLVFLLLGVGAIIWMKINHGHP